MVEAGRVRGGLVRGSEPAECRLGRPVPTAAWRRDQVSRRRGDTDTVFHQPLAPGEVPVSHIERRDWQARPVGAFTPLLRQRPVSLEGAWIDDTRVR